MFTRTHNDNLLKESSERNTFIASSATRNSANMSVGSVGFLLSYRAIKSCIAIYIISDRIIMLTPENNPRTTILYCYILTNVSSEEDINTALFNIPAHNMLRVAGYFNAKIGPKKALHTFSTETEMASCYPIL